MLKSSTAQLSRGHGWRYFNASQRPRETGLGWRVMMFRKLVPAAAALLFLCGTAFADPIVGNWRTQAGATAHISSCGGSFCIQLKTGKFAGKSIGKFKAAGESSYTGSITDPESDKTYSGKGALAGSKLKMSGCVLGGLICRSQTWTKL